jgi:hypothetical protein
MEKRPITVTIVSWVLIAAGVATLAYHFTEVKPQQLLQGENILIFLVRFLAILCGVFMLRGRNWARWLAVAWIGFHVALSFFHFSRLMAVHALLLGLFALALFRPEARSYFRRRETSGV